MVGKKFFNSEIKNSKWIKEGRGSGRGADYLPWITVRDLGSRGRSHRIFGYTTQRTQHLLSDLELAVFLIIEWNNTTTDVREQFPLRLEDTKALAIEAGIKHPNLYGVDQIMSSDFLVNTNNPNCLKFSLQAKYAKDLQDPRTVEKLELERRYWQSKSVPWQVVTEKEIPKVVFQNINWLYPAQRNEIENERLLSRMEFYRGALLAKDNPTIIELTRKLDSAYNMELGESLLELRQLMAQRYFKFDIFIPFNKLKCAELTVGDASLITEARRVSS